MHFGRPGRQQVFRTLGTGGRAIASRILASLEVRNGRFEQNARILEAGIRRDRKGLRNREISLPIKPHRTRYSP
jgi:hypothetical protein